MITPTPIIPPMPDTPEFNARLAELQYHFVIWSMRQPWMLEKRSDASEVIDQLEASRKLEEARRLEADKQLEMAKELKALEKLKTLMQPPPDLSPLSYDI